MPISRSSAFAGVVAGLALAPAYAVAGDLATRGDNRDWSGFYAGILVAPSGFGVDVKGVGKKDDADLASDRLTAGLLAGYNFTSGPWVWGVEADIAPMGFDTSKALAGLGKVSASSDVAATVRLRGGYAWDDLLLYATAGIAFSDLEIRSSLGGKEEMGLGTLVAGIGAEYAWSDSWRLRLEGLVFGIDDVDVRLAGEKREIAVGESSLRFSVIHKF